MKRDDYFVEELQDELECKKDVLHTAYKAQVLSSKVGFDFNSIRDAFFALINLARFMGISPSELLYQTTKKYLQRVAFIEEELKKEGASWEDKSLKELDKLWDKAKEHNL